MSECLRAHKHKLIDYIVKRSCTSEDWKEKDKYYVSAHIAINVINRAIKHYEKHGELPADMDKVMYAQPEGVK